MNKILKIFLLSFVCISLLSYAELQFDLSEQVFPPPPLQQNNQNSIQNSVKLEIQSLNPYIQLNNEKDQVIPFGITIKTEEIQNLNLRKGIDLICVIDNSGSMEGQNLLNVKRTLLYLIEQLTDEDRLSLITFSTESKILIDLSYTTSENKSIMGQIIKSIDPLYSTNISAGMKNAFDVLSNGYNSKRVSSIFLLSDGMDNASTISVKELLSKQYSNLQDWPFTIHTFGYGHQHDSQLMREIASLKDGNFQYVEDIEKIDLYFASELAGLYTVLAQDIEIQLAINKYDHLVQKYLSQTYISKIYGDNLKIINTGEQLIIKINQLLSGISKDYIFEITIPANDIPFEDRPCKINFLRAQLYFNQLNDNFIDLGREIDESYNIKSILRLNLYSKNDIIKLQDMVKNPYLEYHLLRVKAAEAIQKSMKDAEKGDYDIGKMSLILIEKEIQQASPKAQENLESVKKDIQQSILNVEPTAYHGGGNKQMLYKSIRNFNQQSNLEENDMMQLNNIQKEYVLKQKQKKDQKVDF